MTERWMLGALAAGALLGLAALAADRVAGWFGLPRRGIWTAAMAGSLLLPAAAALSPGLVPAIRLPASADRPRAEISGQGSTAARTADGGESGRAAPSPRPLPTAFGIAWLAATLATLGALAWGQRRLRAACGPCTGRRVAGTRLLVSERAGPMVLGLLDPQIVLPRWALEAPEACGLIVRHEREHLFAGDPLLLALASLAVAALPWSPALWWQHRRLRLAVETDCDARVIAAGESRRRYGRVLLSAAAHPLVLPRPALAWGGPSSHLERRILAMTEARPRHRVLRAIPFAAVACACAAAACGAAASSAPAVPTHAETRLDTVILTDTAMRTDTVMRITRRSPMTPRVTLQGRVSALEVAPDGGMSFTLDRADGSPPVNWVVAAPARGPLAGARSGSPAGDDGLRVGDEILSWDGSTYPGPSYVRIRRGNEVRDVPFTPARPAR